MGRKQPPAEAGAPMWMCTYGDLMSLLLCFFIMLFALSIIAEVKYEAFIETIEAKMGYTGHSKVPSQGNKTSTAMSSASELSRRNAALTGGQPMEGPAGESPSVQTIDITDAIVKGGLIRFDLGSDELTVQAKKDLEMLFPKLLTASNKIMVKGHAAPAEEEGGIYRRDIYLAHARATKVMDYLVSLGLKKEFFQMSAANSASSPNRAILPSGSGPKLSGASAAVFLLDGTIRTDLPEEPTNDAPMP